MERAHALRAPFKCRFRDWLWVAGTFIVLVGFGSISVASFVRPVADISSIDGRCRMGVPRYITIPLVAYDVCINILLTLVFIYLLSPLVRFGTLPIRTFPATRFTKCLSGICRRSKAKTSMFSANQGNQHAITKLEKLLWKTFTGSVLVMIPTVGNFVALTSLGGRELGWVCLTTCTFDGTFVRVSALLHIITQNTSGLDRLCLPLAYRGAKRKREKTS